MGGRLMPRGYAEDEDPFAGHRIGYDARLRTSQPQPQPPPRRSQPQPPPLHLQPQPHLQLHQQQPPLPPLPRSQQPLALRTAAASVSTTTSSVSSASVSSASTGITTASAAPMQGPSGAVVLDGYRKDMTADGFAPEKPLYNPANARRPQSSLQLSVDDPVQVHLLVETALVDSREYEILAPEEVDALKREIHALSQRIEATRQNLSIQSKYRDAANSMAKLYGGAGPDGAKKPSHARTDSVEAADLERAQSEKRCEALAAELWTLEKRLMAPQNRLLRHTAGILQMTHKGPKNAHARGATAPSSNGIPGSPESIYTYHNGRADSEPISDEIVFDERSFYRTADRLDAFSDAGGRDSLGGPPPRSQAREQLQLIAKTEQALEDLNTRLRDVIVTANPQRQNTYSMPPLARTNPQGRPADPGETLQSHLDYMGRSIQTIDQEHGLAARHQQEAERAVEERVEELNREIRGLLLPYDPHHPEPPELTGRGLNQQLLYFQESIGAVEMELSSAARKGTRLSGGDAMEKMIMGLWETIQAGEADARQRKLERRAARAANNLPDDEEDSPDDGPDYPETFSLPAFSSKIQMLYAQATRLKDQKKVLQRQIKQQRELNSKSDATRDAEMQAKTEELDRVNAFLARTEADAERTREELSDAMTEIELLREQGGSGGAAAAAELEAAQKAVHELEDQLQDLRDDHQIGSAEAESQRAESAARIAELTAQAARADAAIKAKEQEAETVRVEVARLQTEVTLARAELDGAYGTRAERAAEVAAMQSPIDAQQVQELRRELDETITEYEAMTKASIEWEKERDRMEEAIDRLRDEKEALESRLNEEKVRWMGMSSPGSETPGSTGGAGSTSTSTMVLRNEFKKMMRDTRAESAKALRAEQAERRKLEDELRALKRQQGPGKSGLSQSVRSPA